MALLSLLPIVGFGLLAARLLGTGTAVALLHAVSAIILVLYVGGLAGVLWPTALVLHLAGVVALGHELWWRYRERRRPELPVPIAILIACTILVYLVHGKAGYLFYDEFAHWGVYLREMLAFDGFWRADTNSMHPRYPPAAPLWLYFFGVFREPSEGLAHVAQFVLLLTPLLVLWERLEWRQWYWSALILALGLLLLTNYGLGINSLYVDHVIGAWFAGTILGFVLDAPRGRQALAFVLPLTMLALIKESTFQFALAGAGTLGLLLALASWQSSHRMRSAIRDGAILAAVFAASATLALQAWSLHLDRIGAPEDLEAVGGIVSGLLGNENAVDAEQGAEITRRFVEVFVGQQLGNDAVSRQFNAFSYSIRDLFEEPYRLTGLGLFVIFAVWWAILLCFVLRGHERLRWVVAAGCVAFTGAAYVFALYLGYRFAFGDYGLVLSSYTRYVNTIALPMLLLAFAPLLPAFRASGAAPALHFSGRRVAVSSLLAVAGCAALYFFETPYLRPVFEPNPRVLLRQELEPATSAIRSMAGSSPVWVYLPNDQSNKFVGRLIQYLLAPTPAYIERDTAFLDRDHRAVFDAWAPFAYVWLAGELDTAAQDRFVAITGLAPSERFFTVDAHATGKAALTPAIPDR